MLVGCQTRNSYINLRVLLILLVTQTTQRLIEKIRWRLYNDGFPYSVTSLDFRGFDYVITLVHIVTSASQQEPHFTPSLKLSPSSARRAVVKLRNG